MFILSYLSVNTTKYMDYLLFIYTISHSLQSDPTATLIFGTGL